MVNLCNDSVMMINIWEGGYLVTDTQLNFTFRELDTPWIKCIIKCPHSRTF